MSAELFYYNEKSTVGRYCFYINRDNIRNLEFYLDKDFNVSLLDDYDYKADELIAIGTVILTSSDFIKDVMKIK